MAVKAADLEAELIDTVCARVRERLPEGQATPCEQFVRQYYHWVPAEDLSDRSPLDLYGAAVAHWNLAQHRAPGEAKVHVYNPEFEHDGWQSPHTVIEIVSDDMPFIVDSVTMELNRQGYGIDQVIHPVILMRRDEDGGLLDVLEQRPDDEDSGVVAESILHVEISRQTDRGRIHRLRGQIEHVLDQVRDAVEDWQPMRGRALALIEDLDTNPPPVDKAEIAEIKAFLAWLTEDHFTFLGYREYDLVRSREETGLKAVIDSGLGILRRAPVTPYTKLSRKAVALAEEPRALLLTKANSRAPVHRPAYMDYIALKRYGADGRVVGERRFLGLYTTAAYKASAREIPIVRGHVEAVLERAGFPPDSHDTKGLLEIIESYPRQSLLQIEVDDLFEISMGILGLGERQRVRLFIRRDPLDRFADCLVCIPRDRFNTDNRERVGRILMEELDGRHVDWTLQLSESLLVRVHYVIHATDGLPATYDVREIESRLVHATRAWTDDLREALIEERGEEQGARLYARYARAFPPGYTADWVARLAVVDINRIEQLESRDEPIMSLYRPIEATEGMVRCKLFSAGGVSLSDVLPTLEHMGAKVVDEQPYEITPEGAPPVWIYDFGLRIPGDDVESVREAFQDAFLGVWRGELEDDGLNGLVLEGALSGRQITAIRAIAKYLRQTGIPFSDAYMERTLLAHPDIARQLHDLFVARFDPDRRDVDRAERTKQEIEQAIDAVESLDQDRILRSFLAVVCAVLRTNFFKTGGPLPRAGDRARPYLSFKLDPAAVPNLPLPRPKFEIFVYSPQVEGVHLRGGKVARGGLRWSDRPEDFRTEVLGLMKAQMVKNALIVPVGSKGGFVVKRPPPAGRREALQKEGIACYKTFLSGLLDLTDNIDAGDVVPPDRVVRYDDDDPYLVVAADKGTASFSDIANEVSARYRFWLGDAFASGGSKGYDHKQMGITARGAWESVKRHFRELGTDIQLNDFTVVGIGDMSGDVFGNGMLRSHHIKLVAAFDHRHVFLDPDPDPETSFKERRRLFEQPRSSWSDYDESRISEGGGVYRRTAKSIPISDQVKRALEIEDDELSPADLVRQILRAPVDLLWNGGVGTYVKAADESHTDVGDKANDGVRVNGGELRCRVVAEGGNLGFTQRGRIEYALADGRINTDAIDNVAGVNCSDHEVNIKILLDGLVADGEITETKRNELLVEMTDAVAETVLYASYTQTQAMSLALFQAASMIDVHARLIRSLEQVAGLNREIEFLPDDKVLSDRKVNHRGLVGPELAVVMAYCKIHLYSELLESDLPEDEFLRYDLERYFPNPLPDRYTEPMGRHRLRREIIATVVANQLVDRAGTTFAFRMSEETGASASLLARGFAVAREVYGMRSFWAAVEDLDNRVESGTQLRMLVEGRRLVERATRWLVRSGADGIDIAATIEHFEPGARMLAQALPDVLGGEDRERYDEMVAGLTEAMVPEGLARRVAAMSAALSVFDIVEVAGATRYDADAVMRTYFRLGSGIELNWLRDRIFELPRANRWQALARAALRDDLYSLHRALTQEVLEAGGGDSDAEDAIETWKRRNQSALERSVGILSDIKASRNYDMTTLPVALREVRNLIRGDGTGAAAPAAHPGRGPAPAQKSLP